MRAKLDAVRPVLYASLVDIVKMLQENRADETGCPGGGGYWAPGLGK